MPSFPVDYLQIKGCLKKNMETNAPLNKVKVVYLFSLLLLPLNTFLWQFNARCYFKTSSSVCINIALLKDSSGFSRSQRVGAVLSNMRWKKIANKGKVLTIFLGLVCSPQLILLLLLLVFPDPPQNYSLDFTSSELHRKSNLIPWQGLQKAMQLSVFRWSPELPLPSTLCNPYPLAPEQRFRHLAPKVKKVGHPNPSDFGHVQVVYCNLLDHLKYFYSKTCS